MPPPPSPLTHRRNRLNTNTPDLSSCVPRKMPLSKGATFHSSSSSASDVDPVLSIQYLSRRSPTCSHASLSSLLSEKRGLAAHAIADFEETFSGARGPSRSSRRRSAESFNQQLKEVRTALPTDEGLGSSVSSPSEKGISKSLARVDLDSGLGDSVDGSVLGDGLGAAHTSEKDSPVAGNLIQGWLHRCLLMCSIDIDDLFSATNPSDVTSIQTRQQGRRPGLRTTETSRPRRTQPTSTPTTPHPSLSRFAKKKISELLFTPLLKEERFKAFHPIVTHLGSRVNKNIRCLRDLERSLIFQPLVSILYPLDQPNSNQPSKTRTSSVSPRLYQSFGELTIQLVIDTYGHLSETEQRRVTDRAYSNGYFLDLVQQVTQLASHIGSSSDPKEADQEVDDEEIYSIEDEVTLEGGLGTTGDFAELVRWRNGKGISLRTGLPYEPMAGLKRQHSTMTDEEIERSMARRKKGYIPEIIDMVCSDPDCGKIFHRKCDLAKHEKTHSRPFKCPIKSCKYHELGLPTEKEKDRHMNDKHDSNPRLYPCLFCEFKTKRESNCKQHMEKKHNWEYKRAKGKDKDNGSTPAQTPQLSTMDYNSSGMPLQSPASSNYGNWDDQSSVAGSLVDSAHGSTHFTPIEDPVNNFDFNAPFPSVPLFPRQATQGTPYVQSSNQFGYETAQQSHTYDQVQGYISPVKTTPESGNVRMTPVTPAYSAFTPQGQSPFAESLNYTGGAINNTFYQDGLPTPESAAYPYSRQPSVQYEQPYGMEQTLTNNPMLGPDIQLPQDDFALNFENMDAFTNMDAANQTLFDSKDLESQQFDAMFDNTDLTGMDYEMEPSYDDMINYDGH